ncbi:hypothetical protein CU669_20470 [Paramagnetospirillum kuznetsovii]|uniref:BLUF domain-containing protein n=1 Tax=Paramagnetospirillum kuznetsovii TaxID=2053833 RepID=A0A364NSI2_9PROT|nr:BLUF domain-containing protein [Paramagnetospirillum kuznetsovii]RAU20053.1 hypothetical protein CU669_20470 [Paramagnetospirillum kuznetsovii]
MLQIIYASATVAPMSDDELGALLAQSRDKNAHDDITGLLVYENGSFLQVIEGLEDRVSPLFDRIKLDPRHNRVRLLPTKNVAEREFGDWVMAYARPHGAADADDGYLDYATDDQLGFDTSEAGHLLSLFRDGLLRQGQNEMTGMVTVTFKARRANVGVRQQNWPGVGHRCARYHGWRGHPSWRPH